MFDRWLGWADGAANDGGAFRRCGDGTDDRPGPARDNLVRAQRDWFDFIAGAVRIAQQEGHLSPDASPSQFAQDMFGIALGWHHASRLLRDPDATRRAHQAFDRLISDVRPAAVRK